MAPGAARSTTCPTRQSGEGIGRAGTAPVLASTRPTASRCGSPAPLPPELRLTLIHADRLAGDARLAASGTSRSALRASVGVASVPGIYTARHWGADESWRDGAPRYNSTILQAHVHHTATSTATRRPTCRR